MTAAISQRASWLYVPLLLVIVTFAWCAHYQRWSRDSWSIPVAFLGDKTWDSAPSSDAIWGMAATKARVDGEISFFNKQPISFGAPFRANWNGWPTVEEAVDCWWALLVRAFGLFAGSNLTLLSAHLLAALSFYFICRYLRYDATIAFAFAILFALSRYAFWRGLPHLTLTFYWHLPLILLVLWWCIRPTAITGEPKKLWFSAAVVVLTGFQNAYYSAMFLQLLFWAALYCVLRPGTARRALFPVALAALLLATIAFANIDTLHSWLTNGSSLSGGPRTYAEGELYALRPVELLLPRSHSLAALSSWTNHVYFGWSLYPGEEGSVYLGLVGIATLAALFIVSFWMIVNRRLPEVPPHFWAIFLIVCFSIVDGLNGFLALAGIHLFHCTNRYSIVILTILLLFGAKQLTRLTRRWHQPRKLVFAVLLLTLGIYDQLPPRHSEQLSTTRKTLAEDSNLVSQIEARLPPAAKIFQLPVCEFPENPQINAMVDYEHFRPYLHSQSLQYAYGDLKLNGRTRWQKEAERLESENYEPWEMVKLLELYGFDAILVNRRGYIDRGLAVIDDLKAGGAGPVLSYSEDLACLRLNPARQILLPPIFADGWYDVEGDETDNVRWSSGNATLILANSNSQRLNVYINFGVASSAHRSLKIMSDGQLLHEGIIKPGEPPQRFNLAVDLKPGANELYFLTDKPGISSYNLNQRGLAYKLIDFQVSAIQPGSSQFKTP